MCADIFVILVLSKIIKIFIHKKILWNINYKINNKNLWIFTAKDFNGVLFLGDICIYTKFQLILLSSFWVIFHSWIARRCLVYCIYLNKNEPYDMVIIATSCNFSSLYLKGMGEDNSSLFARCKVIVIVIGMLSSNNLESMQKYR